MKKKVKNFLFGMFSLGAPESRLDTKLFLRCAPMNRLLLASRTIRVQSSSPFSCAFNRSLSTTACRKFRSTGAVNKRSRIHAVPDAFFGAEEELTEWLNEPESMFSKFNMVSLFSSMTASKPLKTTRREEKQPSKQTTSVDF